MSTPDSVEPNESPEENKQVYDWVWTIPPAVDPIFCYQPSLIILFCLIAGISLDKYGNISCWQVWLNLGIVATLFWIIGLLIKSDSWRIRTGSICIALGLMSVGGLWHYTYWNIYSVLDLCSFLDSSSGLKCVIRGTITESPRRVESPPRYSPLPEFDKTIFTMAVNEIRDGQKWIPVYGKTRITITGHLLGFHAGDEIELSGIGRIPPSAEVVGDFDYQEYLRGKRILSVFSVLTPEAVSLIRSGERFSFLRWFGRCQDQAQKSLSKRIDSGRQARLAGAFLLGNRNDLPEEMIRRFQETGTIHILVVSGLHVMMLAMLLHFLLRLLPISRRARLIAVSIMILFYVGITGMQPPAVRAGILCLIGAIAAINNQRVLSYNVLASSGIVVLFLNPTALFNAGTQLSFLTVVTIIALAPFVEQAVGSLIPTPTVWTETSGLVEQLTWKRRIAQAALRLFLMGSLIFLVIAPLVATRFHVLSLFSVFLNVLLWIPIFIASLSGMLTIIIGAFDIIPLFDWAADYCAWVCKYSLWFIEYGVQTIHSWHWTRFWVSGLYESLLVSFYLILALWLFLPYWRKNRIKVISLLACWAAIVAIIPVYRDFTRPEQLEIEFLNVGHGLCTLVRLPDGKNLLYDAGQMTSPENGAQSVSNELWRQGITKIHGVLLSHADADHYNMLPDLADRFSIDTVYLSPMTFSEGDNQTLNRFHRFLTDSHVNTIELLRGDTLGNSQLYKAEILHPGKKGVLDLYSPENANSMVLSLQYAGRNALLTGDLVGNGIAEVMAEQSPGYDIIQAPHHGSYLSLSDEFIKWTKAQYAVFPESKSYSQSKGRQMFQQHGVRVIHLGETGTTRFIVSADGNLSCNCKNKL